MYNLLLNYFARYHGTFAIPVWYKRLLSLYKINITLGFSKINHTTFLEANENRFAIERVLRAVKDPTANKDVLTIFPHQLFLVEPNKELYLRAVCTVTKTYLGELVAEKDPISNVIVIKSLATMRGLAKSLHVQSTMGTNIGSLLMSSLTLLLCRYQLSQKITLAAYASAVNFYTKIGMTQRASDQFDAEFTGVFPGEVYYSTMLEPTALNPHYFSSILAKQRHIHYEKIMKQLEIINKIIAHFTPLLEDASLSETCHETLATFLILLQVNETIQLSTQIDKKNKMFILQHLREINCHDSQLIKYIMSLLLTEEEQAQAMQRTLIRPYCCTLL